MSNEEKSGTGIGGIFGGLQEKAGAIGDAVKGQVEGVVGAENVKKVTDTLNTDVGAMSQDAVNKAKDAAESLLGRDLDGDGDIAGKPIQQ